MKYFEKRKKMDTFSSYCRSLATVSRSATKWQLCSSNWFPIPRSIICSEMVEVVYTNVRWDSQWTVGYQKPTANVLIEYWRLVLHVLNLSVKVRRFAIRCHRFKFTCSSMMSLVSVRRLNRNISKMKESSLEWSTHTSGVAPKRSWDRHQQVSPDLVSHDGPHTSAVPRTRPVQQTAAYSRACACRQKCISTA
jgi:hypothetical protein